MRRQEIKALLAKGVTEFAVGRVSSGSASRYKCRVLGETDKRQVPAGNSWSSRKKDASGWLIDGLVASYLIDADDQGRPCLPSAMIHEPWSEYVERKRVQDRTQRAADEERAIEDARAAAVIESLAGYGIQAKAARLYGNGPVRIELLVPDAEKVLGLMSIPADPGPVEVGQ